MLTRFIVCAILCLGMAPSRVLAGNKPARVEIDGFLSLQAPVWSSRAGWLETEKRVEFAGQVQVHHFVPVPLTLVLTVNYDLGGWHSAYNVDSLFQAGFEYPAGKDTTFFTYWDSEPALGENRYWVGMRWNFAGR